MTVKARIVIQSHLSDVQHSLMAGVDDSINLRLNFVKYITNKVDDITSEIDPDKMFTDFLEANPHYNK